MWPKQREAENDMTSLKDKITHRKRKGNKSKNAQPVECANTNTNTATNKQSKKANKHNNARNASKTAAAKNDLPIKNKGEDSRPNAGNHVNSSVSQPADCKRISAAYAKDDVSAPDKRTLLQIQLNPDLVLREHSFDDGIYVSSYKRYSDSFVLAHSDPKNNRNDGKLSRAHSGYFVTDVELRQYIKSETDRPERKSRRFSDIFRYGNLKPSSSCDNLKLHDQMVLEEKLDAAAPRKMSKLGELESAESKSKKGKKVGRSDSKASVQREAAPKAKKADAEKNGKVEGGVNGTNSSYLKRVKSKIYKTKTDNGSVLPSMPELNENAKGKKGKNKKNDSKDKDEPTELRNSVSHFDFRLLRQTSNLERIRPQTYVHKKSSSNVGIDSLLDNGGSVNAALEKPVLAKSKSSSAINLNLLRTRRNKIMEQMKKNCKPAHDEFDFIAFGSVQNSSMPLVRKFGSQNLTSTINNNVSSRPNSWLHGSGSSGDTKPGHPVTRTGSDRRPDAVREETSKVQDSHTNTHENEDDATTTETSKSLPGAPVNKRRNTSNINRSESVKEQSEKRKQRRNISDPSHNTSESVDIDHPGLSSNTHSGSSSNASLSSSRSSNDSPSSSIDASPYPVSQQAGSEWGSDEEIEADPPDWQSTLTEEELTRLQPHEKKRQDVINELFHTERSHLRNLRVLQRVFHRPLTRSDHLKQDELQLVFSNLSALIDIHSQFTMLMKSKRKESAIVKDIGDILTSMFDGSLGENFQDAAAMFCERQKLALEFIKEKRRKDTKFDALMNELEKNPHCRRLPLQGFLPSEMQRLSKYPLLLERLIDIVDKNREKDSEYSQTELLKLQLAHNRSKEILNHVNEAAKQAENKARLEDIHRHLDTSVFDKSEDPLISEFKEFKNLDITKYNLIHEGPAQLKRPNKVNHLNIHVVLLEEFLLMLHKEGERYILKFFHSSTNQQTLPPIIKMSTLIFRNNATNRASLLLINTQNSSMQELLVRDNSDRKTWFKHLSDAADAYQKREGKTKNNESAPNPEEETTHELPSTREVSERAESVGGTEAATVENDQSTSGTAESSQRNNDVIEEEGADKEESETSPVVSCSTTGGGVSMKFAADDWPLIQPSEVQVELPPVHTAEPVLTPIEQIRRKGEEVQQALEDKEKLVADLLSIPRSEYRNIADMVSQDQDDREPSELVLAAIYQADQLVTVVNESLNMTDADPVLLTGGKHPSCASNEAPATKNNIPSVPVHRLQDIATSLSSQLTTLLSVVKQREEERERLRKELQRTREQLHEKLSIHSTQYSDLDEVAQLESTQSGDLESIEESPTENEST